MMWSGFSKLYLPVILLSLSQCGEELDLISCGQRGQMAEGTCSVCFNTSLARTARRTEGKGGLAATAPQDDTDT